MTYTDNATRRAAAIAAHGITKSFGNIDVLRGVDLVVPQGSAVALLGPNGAGKTTLIRILATLLRPDAGSVTIAGFDLARDTDDVKRAVSLTGQHAAVDRMLTGRENLVMLGRLRRLPHAAAVQRSAELLEQFDLVDVADRRTSTYSGGTRRKLDLAISLVVPPTVVLLDEPTTGLDPRSREMLWATVRGMVDAGVTLLITTQYLEEADRLADRVALLDGGRIVAEGTPDELKAGIAGEIAALEFADDTTFERAKAMLSTGQTPLAGIDIRRRTVRVGTDSTAAAVRDLLDQMDRGGAPVQRLSLYRPTLDDVFLALTDRKATL